MNKGIDYIVNRELQLRRLGRKESRNFLEKAMNRELWNLKVTGVYEAQRYSLGEGVKIGVINSGADIEHSEVASRIGGGFNYVNWDYDLNGNIIRKQSYDLSSVEDENGHGTHIASIIAGGLIGIAPKAELYILKVADEKDNIPRLPVIIEAIKRCVSTFDVNLINLSLGTNRYREDLQGVCREAYSEGVILVASAGNTRSGVLYPASYDGVISVGATNELNRITEFSNISPKTCIVAPGENIFGADIPSDGKSDETAYALGDGISMAAAHVTGILALALSYSKKKGKKLRLDELVKIMKETAFMPDVSKEEFGDLLKSSGFDLVNGGLGINELLRYVYGSGIISAEMIIKKLS